MTKPIAEQVAELEIGDWVEATQTYGDYTYITRGPLLADGEKGLRLNDVYIRWINGDINNELHSITRVPSPIPSEPEVGSFALLDDGDVAQKDGNGHLESWRRVSNRFGLVVVKSWREIYPRITRLYSPSGDLVTGFEYAGGNE